MRHENGSGSIPAQLRLAVAFRRDYAAGVEFGLDFFRTAWKDSRDNSPKVRGRLIAGALAVGLLVALAASGGYLQTTYPGGFAQWASDTTGPPRLSAADIRVAVQKALLTTSADTWHGKATTQGSAFFMQDGTTVVTAAHVLPPPVVKLVVLDSAGSPHAADLMSTDATTDVAVLRVQGLNITPLKSAIHPLYPHSHVFLAGIPAPSSPGSVVTGVVVNTDYTAKHLLLVSGGPVASGMSGGPVVDEWGKVVGQIGASAPDGNDVTVIPVRTLGPIVAAAAKYPFPEYIGPPMITTPASQLVLGPSNFPNRKATSAGNQVSYLVGSPDARYERGSLFLAVYNSIASATTAVSQCQSNLGTGWPKVASGGYALGDGGRLYSGASPYGDRLLLVCWSDRNAFAVWWIEWRGNDATAFFGVIANQEEQILSDAT